MGIVLAVLGEDEDRALAGGVGLLAVLDDVHAERLLVLAGAQRHHRADQLAAARRSRRTRRPGRERGERLVAELGGVAVEQAVGDAVPGDLREEADEEDADEAGDAVGGEHVERLVDPGARAPDDDRVARQRGQRAEHHRPAGADEAAGGGDPDAADDDRGGGADRGHLAAADQVEQNQTTSVQAGVSSVFVNASTLGLPVEKPLPPLKPNQPNQSRPAPSRT